MMIGIAITINGSAIGLTHTPSTAGAATVRLLANKITQVKLPKSLAVKRGKFTSNPNPE